LGVGGAGALGSGRVSGWGGAGWRRTRALAPPRPGLLRRAGAGHLARQGRSLVCGGVAARAAGAGPGGRAGAPAPRAGGVAPAGEGWAGVGPGREAGKYTLGGGGSRTAPLRRAAPVAMPGFTTCTRKRGPARGGRGPRGAASRRRGGGPRAHSAAARKDSALGKGRGAGGTQGGPGKGDPAAPPGRRCGGAVHKCRDGWARGAGSAPVAPASCCCCAAACRCRSRGVAAAAAAAAGALRP
jgi:hypothetical protein